jgi:hypothetical protein
MSEIRWTVPSSFRGIVLFGETVMDTVDDGFSETVDCPRDPVALTENFAASGEVNEMIDVCPSPAVDGLIVVTCTVHSFGFFVDGMSYVPL